MGSLKDTFSYSVGKKMIVGLTGLFLIVFLIEHLMGNMLLLVGPLAFNAYAKFMGSNPIIRIAEVGLFLGFIAHIVMALRVSSENDRARPVKYAVDAGSANANWFSRNMRTTGLVILVFLLLHLASFWVGVRISEGLDLNLGAAYDYHAVSFMGEHSIWHKAAAHFAVEWYSALYVLAMVFVAFHLNHGFQSVFQSMGWRHKKYTPLIEMVGKGFSILIPLAFSAIPVYFLIMKYMGKLAPMFGPGAGITL